MAIVDDPGMLFLLLAALKASSLPSFLPSLLCLSMVFLSMWTWSGEHLSPPAALYFDAMPASFRAGFVFACLVLGVFLELFFFSFRLGFFALFV